MGSSYQTVLATGNLVDVRAAVSVSQQVAVIIPVAESRWAVVPLQEDGIYAEAENLAELLSLAQGSVAASFDVFDSDVMVAKLFRDGRSCHEYLSDQAYLVETWDDDDNEILFDLLGRPYPPGVSPSSGAYGADPAVFAALGVVPIDETELGVALSRSGLRAEEQHHAILHALNLNCGPLTMSFKEAEASGLGV
ncbi:hypothetical protein GA0074696_3831 [Micromonospora purpureochromogenes]|uniref:Uncharacterized protein n=1 Tax=Micromonospora purpureochromogenes TaxID=47872 RepID=A0A1C4YZ69_9ACTN|nr:hypothetical protein [Micromonospora purpureochromogenes]SCF25631.1 hypothetical protein GA0074696_3831 [Micromonospora purpureochromogenes]